MTEKKMDYWTGYEHAKKEYEGVTIDGLKATMDVMEIALMNKDRRIKELEDKVEYLEEFKELWVSEDNG